MAGRASACHGAWKRHWHPSCGPKKERPVLESSWNDAVRGPKGLFSEGLGSSLCQGPASLFEGERHLREALTESSVKEYH